ncbi:hypothetical protein G7Z17_g10159 [Cylindrodendrum hubeiense]|uniref:Uncharacterized protein n=1 Tax=Cylindrodendrum hubeiense TaxID=595255 RepID=A0A9P5GZ67_9HYPO|nr:hypothetical protein G7Z17_g10159 [Cylindrodendrum hubeiense]
MGSPTSAMGSLASAMGWDTSLMGSPISITELNLMDAVDLKEADRRLEKIAADPRLLRAARRRFSVSPSPLRGSPIAPSTASTRSYASNLTPCTAPKRRNWSPDQKPGQFSKYQILMERAQSSVYHQFGYERTAEMKRILEARSMPTDNLTGILAVYFGKSARATVTERWKAQGIWDNRWDGAQSDDKNMWKHESPLTDDEEEELDGETELEPSPPRVLFFASQQSLQPKRSIMEEEKKKQRAIAKQEKDASRPFQRFHYMVSREQERLMAKQNIASAKPAESAPPDIYTQAYTNVRANWVERGLWYRKWGQLPGMSWRHELPFDPDDLWIDGCGPPPPCDVSPEGPPPISPLCLGSAKANDRGCDQGVVNASPPDSSLAEGYNSIENPEDASGSVPNDNNEQSSVARRTRSHGTQVHNQPPPPVPEQDLAEVHRQMRTRQSTRLQVLNANAAQSKRMQTTGDLRSDGKPRGINKRQRTTRQNTRRKERMLR